mmetsp:Transcript_8774/g.24206  ORF Transcript_8774/g.24206 Transcript_8774/m.24206 type:complete len:282 (-) Transcript_8774:285-1130(-)
MALKAAVGSAIASGAGPKKSERTALRCQPRLKATASLVPRSASAASALRMRSPSPRQLVAAASLLTMLPGSPRPRRLSRLRTSGGSRGTNRSESVTRRDRVARCPKATSTAAYPRPRRLWGRRIEKGSSRAQLGMLGARARSSSTLAPASPSRGRGRSSGNAHWSGATQTCARGNRRLNAGTNTLCSYCVVPSTTCSTGPPSSSRRSRHSRVGATGLSTHSPPDSRRTTVMRALAAMVAPSPKPRLCSCSNDHTRSRFTSVRMVARSKRGPRGNGNPVRLM